MRVFNIIEVKEITTDDGKKFNAYKTVAKDGTKMDVRFVRSCQNIPTEPCAIEVEDEDCNVSTAKRFPILWIKNVKAIKPIERHNNVGDYFD